MDEGDGGDFPPHVLREYSFIADGERGALIGPRGDLVWMCAPTWSSDAVFCSLLGGASQYVVAPTTPRYTWGGYYEDGTLIWRSRWVTSSGVVECREALAFPGETERAVVLRRIVAVDADAEVRIALTPRAGFDAHPVTECAGGDGVWTMRTGDLHLRLSGAPHGHFDNGCIEAMTTVPRGGYHDLVLEIAAVGLPGPPVDAPSVWSRTEHAWRTTIPPIDGTLADRDARHAYAVLRGMTSAGGGMVAAATTALPERAEQGRNYDYRFCWVRDQCYAGLAVAAAGPHPLLDEAVRFVSGRLSEAGPQLAPAYRVDGGPVPDEKELDLPGYPGGTAIVGNRVNRQFQLDVFGEALLLLAAADRWDRLDRDAWRAVEGAAAAIEQRWTEPDAGIWEIDYERWTHSRLVCVAGLRAVARRAPRREAAHWTMLADGLLAETSARCLDRRTATWRRSPSDDRVDVALLLPALRGAVAASDPRTVNTLEAVRRDLTQDGYVYRYRHRGRELAEAEGAFLLCGYVMALADHQQGDEWRAVRWFERNRAACGPPGLFTEEFDVVERQLRGDLPQAFVHAMLFETAHTLSRPGP